MRLTTPQKVKVTIAAVLIVVLIGCPIVFTATGGWMARLNDIVNTAVSAATHLDGGITFGNGDSGKARPVTLKDPIDRTETFAAADVAALDVSWHSGSVRLVPAEGSDITVHEQVKSGSYRADPRKATFELEGGTLVVDDGLPDLSNGDDYPPMELTIGVPAEALTQGDVRIESVLADIAVERLGCGDFSLATVSSGVTIDGLSAAQVDLDGVSSTMKLDAIAADELSVSTVSGSLGVRFGDTLPADTAVDTVSGSVTLDVPDDAGFTLSAEYVSGAVSSMVGTVERGEGTARVTAGDGSADMQVDTVSGSINVA